MSRVDPNYLEALIDQYSLADVLEVLGNICHEKADHIRSNWGETENSYAVRHWDDVGNKLDELAAQVDL